MEIQQQTGENITQCHCTPLQIMLVENIPLLSLALDTYQILLAAYACACVCVHILSAVNETQSAAGLTVAACIADCQ